MTPQIRDWILATSSTLLGVIIASGLQVLRDHLARKGQREQRQLDWQREFYKEYISAPIVDSIDQVLALVSCAHRAHLDAQTDPEIDKAEIAERLSQAISRIQDKEYDIWARLLTFRDGKLSADYDRLMRLGALFAICLRTQGLDRTVEEMADQLPKIGAELLARLRYLEGHMEAQLRLEQHGRHSWWGRVRNRLETCYEREGMGEER